MKEKFMTQRVSANCSQENRYQIKIKTTEKDIKKCDKSTTARHSFKTTTDESIAQSISSNSSFSLNSLINFLTLKIINVLTLKKNPMFVVLINAAKDLDKVLVLKLTKEVFTRMKDYILSTYTLEDCNKRFAVKANLLKHSQIY
jgi:hypothetical protein